MEFKLYIIIISNGLAFWNRTFYEQLLLTQILKVQKRLSSCESFLHFWDLREQKLLSISSTLYLRVFRTNVVSAALFLVTCVLRVRGKSCRNGIRTKNVRIERWWNWYLEWCKECYFRRTTFECCRSRRDYLNRIQDSSPRL